MCYCKEKSGEILATLLIDSNRWQRHKVAVDHLNRQYGNPASKRVRLND